MLRPLNAEEREVVRRSHPRLTSDSAAFLFSVRQPATTIVSESGLYKLVMRSDKAEAKDFQHWVTSVVLQQLRPFP